MLTSKSMPIPLLSPSHAPPDINLVLIVGKYPILWGYGAFSANIRRMERQTELVAVFVDGANLYHSIKNYYKGILDYDRLLSAAVGSRKLLRATFYIVEKHETDESQGTPSARSFVYNLNKFGYKVRSKALIVHETLNV